VDNGEEATFCDALSACLPPLGLWSAMTDVTLVFNFLKCYASDVSETELKFASRLNSHIKTIFGR
jgi:hypothetical protein